MQVISYKTRLIIDEESKKAIIEMLEASRNIFNIISNEHFSINENGYVNSHNSIKELHKKVYKKIRTEFPHIKSQLVVRAMNSVLAAYRSIRSNKHKISQPCQKKRLSIQLDKRLYSFKNKVFKITTLQKRIPCTLTLYPKLEEFLEKHLFGDPKIFVENGEIYINIPFKVETTIKNGKLAIGVDLGIRRFAATSEGNIFIDKAFNSRKRSLRFLKRKLRSCGTRSSKRHLRRLRRKERNINKNFNHHLVNAVLNNSKAQIFILEDLKGLKKKKNKYQNKNAISQVSIYEFRRILTYKAALAGKQVVCVSPKYTSQIDSLTNKREGDRIGCRFYAKSGLVYDADINAARNIAHRAKLPISYGNILDGQASVNRLIVGVPS